MTRNEMYLWLKQVLNKDYFKFNDEKNTIEPITKINWEEVEGLRCFIFTLMGGNRDVDWEVQEPHGKFKIDARYIPIDGDTIKEDLDGQLYVDISELVNQDDIVKELLKNQKFVKRIVDSFDQTEMTMHQIKKDLLTDPLFLLSLKQLFDQVENNSTSSLLTPEEEISVVNRAINFDSLEETN